jgi:hypothetical protein
MTSYTELVPDAERVVNAPEEAVVEPIGVFWMDVAVKAPPEVQVGPPVDSLAVVIPPSLTMIAPEESWVVAPSTAPDAKVALSTRLFSVVAVGASLVANVVPLERTDILGSL